MGRKSHRQKKHPVRNAVLLVLLTLLVIGGGLAWRAYSSVRKTTEVIYKPVEQEQIREEKIDLQVDKEKPISILLLGVDTGAEGRVEQGRSDVMIYTTLNPNTNTMMMVSLPRDTYGEIVGRGTMEKINHAYAYGGAEMSVNTVQRLLKVPVDYYITVNMGGLIKLVDLVGGVTVQNNLEFSQGGYYFPIGPAQLSGDQALAYVRNRYDDPAGDVGRQVRQRSVIEAVLSKLVSTFSVTDYEQYLAVMQTDMTTNLTLGDITTLATNYRKVTNNVTQMQLYGQGTMKDGIYYSMSSEADLNRVTDAIKKELEIK